MWLLDRTFPSLENSNCTAFWTETLISSVALDTLYYLPEGNYADWEKRGYVISFLGGCGLHTNL